MSSILKTTLIMIIMGIAFLDGSKMQGNDLNIFRIVLMAITTVVWTTPKETKAMLSKYVYKIGDTVLVDLGEGNTKESVIVDRQIIEGSPTTIIVYTDQEGLKFDDSKVISLLVDVLERKRNLNE